jgi:hypothetical protein
MRHGIGRTSKGMSASGATELAMVGREVELMVE